MTQNYTIIDLNGVSNSVIGISYIRLKSNNKFYAFYTLNEKSENGLPIMYIAEANETANVSMPIDDDAYRIIIADMLKITSGENPEQFEYLDGNGKTFYVGLQKKMIIKDEKINALKDHYNKNVTNNQINSIPEMDNQPTNITPPAPEVPLNNNVIAEGPSNTIVEPAMPEAAQVLEQPTIANPVAEPVMPDVTPTPNVEPLTVDTPLNQPTINQQQEISPIVEPVLDNQNIVEPISNEIPFESPSITMDNNIVEPVIDNPINDEITISYDEALKALETLNTYFKQTKTLPSELVSQNDSLTPLSPTLESETLDFASQESPVQEPPIIEPVVDVNNSQNTQGQINLDNLSTLDNNIVEPNTVADVSLEQPVVMPTSSAPTLQDSGDLLTPNNVINESLKVS